MLRRSSQHPNIISCSTKRKRLRGRKTDTGTQTDTGAKTGTNTEYENENGMRYGGQVSITI